jgi:hypothetical protein
MDSPNGSVARLSLRNDSQWEMARIELTLRIHAIAPGDQTAMIAVAGAETNGGGETLDQTASNSWTFRSKVVKPVNCSAGWQKLNRCGWLPAIGINGSSRPCRPDSSARTRTISSRFPGVFRIAIWGSETIQVSNYGRIYS